MTPLNSFVKNAEFESLYVHFPFCESKCHYCDFYSIGREQTQKSDPPQFLQALEHEANLYKNSLKNHLKTIFFGGGTPSLIPAQQIKKALSPLKIENLITPQTEWTIEANPGSVGLEALKEYRDWGINRVSMGVQSMHDSTLKLLGRVHTAKEALLALDSIFEAGFRSVSVDLLCGVPNQSLQDLEYAIDQLTQYPITHLSCYLLTLSPGHKLFSQLPDEDTQLAHLYLIDQKMKSKQMRHYEISNYAIKGFEAQHNLNYWKGKSYLGLGPSAHSYNSHLKIRFKNHNSLHLYCLELLQKHKPATQWSESLTPTQLELEKWMLALRLDEGFPKHWLITKEQNLWAETFLKKGLIEICPNSPESMRLTLHGLPLCDSIVQKLIPQI